MPIIRLADIPKIAVTSPDSSTLMMKKAIGSRKRDPAFAMPDETPSLSITHIKIWGRLNQITCDETDRAMFVIEGDAIALVGDEKPAYVGPGDFILIPKGLRTNSRENLTYLVINSPAYREGSDIRDASYDGPVVRRSQEK